MKYTAIVILFFILSLTLYSSTNYSPLCKDNEKLCMDNGELCMDNENVIFSFITKNNKIMSICISKDESYIVYRYGTKAKIELEYPEDKNNSWAKFKYSFYFRGGGAANEGIDLNYLKFNNNGYTYTVFQEYSAVDENTIYGIRIENSKNKIEIKGVPKSVIGTLINLRDNKKIKIED